MSGVRNNSKHSFLLSKIIPHKYAGNILKIIAIYIIIILILSMISLPLVTIIGAKEEVLIKPVETVSKETVTSKPSTTTTSPTSTTQEKTETSVPTKTSSSTGSTPTTTSTSDTSSEPSSSSVAEESSSPTSSSSTSSVKSSVSTSTETTLTNTHTDDQSNGTEKEIEAVLSELNEIEDKALTQFKNFNATTVKTTFTLQQKEELTTVSENNDSQQSVKNVVQNTEKILESNLGDIAKDQMITVTTEEKEKETTIIHQVEFTASKNSKNVKLQVSNLKEKPIEIQKELPVSSNAKVYHYLDIKLTENDTYIGESGIATMSFTFVVDKQWIHNNSLDKDTIKMIRYHNGSWQKLNTSYVNETKDMIYYQSYTPGLSVFAVVGESIVEDSDAIVDGSTAIPWWISFGVIASSSMILGVVLIKKRFIYRT